MLRHYAPPAARLGDLTGPSITALCHRAEKPGDGSPGRKRNSVRRTMLRAISHVLRFHLGQAERNRIFAYKVKPRAPTPAPTRDGATREEAA